MRIVPLSPIPNQSFTVTIEGVRWGLSVKEARGVLCVDISRDGEALLTGSRALVGEALIPYRYLQSGNFIFLVTGNRLPDWREFGASQILVFLNAAEIAAAPRITVGEFLAEHRQIEYLTTDDGFYLTTDTGGLLTDD